MPRPTKAALGKHPKAVVLLARSATDVTKIDYDFEWFETDEGVTTFMDEAVPWAEEDVNANGDLQHMLVELTDTSVPPTLGRIEVRSTDEEAGKQWLAEVTADPTLVIAPTAQRATKTSTARVKPKVKPKAPSPAAAALKAQAEEQGKTAMAAKANKAEALKSRLAAKKAAAEAKG